MRGYAPLPTTLWLPVGTLLNFELARVEEAVHDGDEIEKMESLAGGGLDGLGARWEMKALALQGAWGEEEVAREMSR